MQEGLASSSASLTDDGTISSCMLSQHGVVADLVSAQTHGATTEPFQGSGQERADCVKEIDKSGTKFFLGALKAAGKCLSAQSKAGNSADPPAAESRRAHQRPRATLDARVASGGGVVQHSVPRHPDARAGRHPAAPRRRSR
jgi:hypothetical protein